MGWGPPLHPGTDVEDGDDDYADDGDDGDWAEVAEPEGAPDCSGPPGGRFPDKWVIGPDRYYATFGLSGPGYDWSSARRHCENDGGSAVGDAQLAIPYGQDDAHFMKHMDHVRDVQAWVGKLFISP